MPIFPPEIPPEPELYTPFWDRVSRIIHLDPKTYVAQPLPEPDEVRTRRNADRCRPHGPIPGRPDPVPEIEDDFLSDPAFWRFEKELRVCDECGEPFLAGTHNRRYCSEACRKTDYSVQKTCERCGREFQSMKAEQRFCGRSCAAESRKNPANDRACEWCGERYRATTRVQRFCSRECANAWKRSVRHG